MTYSAIKFLLISIVITYSQRMLSQKNNTDSSQLSKIELQIESIKDSASHLLIFTLINRDKKPFMISEFRTNYNRLLITSPDGKELENYYWVEPYPGKSSYFDVLPDSTKTWKLNFENVLRANRLQAIGTYKLRWKVNDVISETFEYIKG